MCGNIESKVERLNEVFNIEGRLVLVEDIPATVCTRCGDVTFSRETTESVRRLVHTQARPVRSEQVAVFAFYSGIIAPRDRIGPTIGVIMEPGCDRVKRDDYFRREASRRKFLCVPCPCAYTQHPGDHMSDSSFPPVIQSVFDEFIPICRQLAGDQRYAISVGGSLGKGTWDSRSDVDFRLFTDRELQCPEQRPELWADCFAAIERWKERGIDIDGVWPRTVGEIDAALDGWLSGEIKPVNLVWTIWGYHILTDVNNQFVIEDPYHIIGAWKERLSVYPPALKQAILGKYAASLRYWRTDYHYAHKVERGDVVFLAGMTSKLVHEIIQILFALNETYYAGDGANLSFVEKFKIVPADFSARVRDILYPGSPDLFAGQYAALATLIDEVLALVDA